MNIQYDKAFSELSPAVQRDVRLCMLECAIAEEEGEFDTVEENQVDDNGQAESRQSSERFNATLSDNAESRGVPQPDNGLSPALQQDVRLCMQECAIAEENGEFDVENTFGCGFQESSGTSRQVESRQTAESSSEQAESWQLSTSEHAEPRRPSTSKPAESRQPSEPLGVQAGAPQSVSTDSIYEVKSKRVKKAMNGRIREVRTKVALRNPDAVSCGRFEDVFRGLKEMLSTILDQELKQRAKPGDKGQIVLTADNMEHFISTPLRLVQDLQPAHILTKLEQALNSGVSLEANEVLMVDVVHVCLDRSWTKSELEEVANKLEGKGRRRDLLTFMNHFRKSSTVPLDQTEDDGTCLAKALVVGKARLKWKKLETELKGTDVENMLDDEVAIEDLNEVDAVQAEKEAAGETFTSDEDVRAKFQRIRLDLIHGTRGRPKPDFGKPALKAECDLAFNNYRQLSRNRRGNRALKEAVKQLYLDAGVKYGTPGNVDILPKFEKVLGVRVKIVSLPEMGHIVYRGSVDSGTDTIYVYYYKNADGDGHYALIANIRGFFGKRWYCEQCDKAYWDRADHRCSSSPDFCLSCYQLTCKRVPEDPICDQKCQECAKSFRSSQCREIHRKCPSGLCTAVIKCPGCDETFNSTTRDQQTGDIRRVTQDEVFRNHECNTYKCPVCRNVVEKGHLCYIQKRKLPEKLQKFMFFDIETDQSTSEHVPNFIHATWFVPGAVQQEDHRSQPEEEDRGSQEEDINNHKTWEGEWKEASFKGKTALCDFLKFLLTPAPPPSKRGAIAGASNVAKFFGYTVIAHNFKAFDGILILRELLTNGVEVKAITNGLKLLALTIPMMKLRFVDSFNFLPMGLARLPAAFGLDCGEKGHFPHFFNTEANQEYVGVGLPDMKYYGVENMDSKSREKFEKWWQAENSKQLPYNFAEELETYCRQDVEILKESCLAYRKLMCEETHCDPFQFVTCASVCSAVYQSTFMPEDSIGTVPPAGYQRAIYSSESLEWLEYLRIHEGVSDIEHAGNQLREKKFGAYYVDGYSKSTNTAYEYYGCFFHGCPNCFATNADVELGKRLRLAYQQTLRREQELKDKFKLNVVTIWGCDWKAKKASDAALRAAVESLDVEPLLHPKDAFFGGRTECFKLQQSCAAGDGKMAYYDVTSLYPCVMFSDEYPVGHPEIIRNNFKSLDEYFGLVKCTVLPPKDLYLPVLPMHCGKNNKLVFPLCGTCAQDFQVDPCKHSDAQRAIKGTWFTEEVKLALMKGYRLVKIHSVFHFPRKSRGQFKDYVKTFYKKKMLSTKVNFETDEEWDAFIKAVHDREGIDLVREDFKENPGLRQLTKLMLNNLWGRYGMRSNMNQTEFTTKFERIRQLDEDPTMELTSVKPVSEHIVQLAYKRASDEYIPMRNDTNIFVAVTTTAWARIRLYRELDKLKERTIYCDTDSVIFTLSENPDQNLKCGNFLGDMTSELDQDDYIVEFVSGGPKNYGYLTKKGKSTVKVKGITMNSVNAPVMQYANIKRIIVNGVQNQDPVEDDETRTRRWSEKRRFIRNKERRQQLLPVHQEATADGSNLAHAIAMDDVISTYNKVKICRTGDWRIVQGQHQKLYTFWFDKRIVLSNFDTIPFGYVRSAKRKAEDDGKKGAKPRPPFGFPT